MRPDTVDDDRLDELLAGASWPQPPPQAAERLEDHWRRVSPARRARWVLRRLVLMSAAAAVVLAGAVMAVIVLRDRTDPIAVSPTRPSSVNQPTAADVRTVMHAPTFPSRALTRREELLLRMGEIAPRAAAERPEAIDMLVRGIVSDALWRPFEDRGPSFRPDIHLRAAEHRLLEDLAGSRLAGDERVEGVRLLSAIGSARSLPALLRLYRQGTTREAALAGVLWLADATTLALLAGEETARPADRPVLLAAMLRRDPELGVRLLIPMVRDADGQMLKPAMAALDAVAGAEFPAGARRVVVEALFHELRGPRIEDRMAAARALGRIDGPETATRLAEMARRDDGRREALAALIWCGDRSEAAAAALEAARRSPRLASTLRSLELTLPDAPPRKDGRGLRS